MLIWSAEWSGINALLYYGPTLMAELGLQGDSVTRMVAGGIGLVQFVAVLPVIIFIDRLGQSPSLSVTHYLYLMVLFFCRPETPASM